MNSDRLNLDILEMIRICIDFPCSLMMGFECSNRTAYRMIDRLISDGYIKKYRKNGISSLRITKRGKNYLIENNPKRFEKKELRKYGKSEIVKRLRLHRIAAAYMMMRRAGFNIYDDEKPDLFSESEVSAVKVSSPIYYGSMEIKSFGIECTKIKFTRAVGVLLSKNDEGFIVYNTEDSLMKWSKNAEQRLYGVLTGILLKNSIQVDDFAGLIIGEKPETALKLLNSSGGVKNSIFKIDNTFNEFYFIPEDDNGILVLNILSCRESRNSIRQSIIQQYGIDTKTLIYSSDGVNEIEQPVLLAYEFDLEKLRKFKAGLEMFEIVGCVYCFDFQREVMSKYFGNLAEIRVIDSKLVAKELKWWNEK